MNRKRYREKTISYLKHMKLRLGSRLATFNYPGQATAITSCDNL